MGAGASCPYGFPTAKQLKNRICEVFASRTTAIRLLGDNVAPAEKFLEFREAFWKSGTASVDAFLKGRPEFKKKPGAVVDASQGITLLHEKESELREVHNLLTAAERVCFLGFSYNPLNLTRLQLKTDTVITREVFGTARHFEKSEIAQTERHLSSTLLCGRVTLDDADNLTVLRRHLILD